MPDEYIYVAKGESAQLRAGQDITESMRGFNMSGNKMNPVQTLQREYFRSNECDLDAEKMDTNQLLFGSHEGESIVAPASSDFGTNDRDAVSDRARANYNPGDGSRAARRSLGEGDIGVGYGGVEYYLEGQGEILPGYPTQEGMKMLISQRMKDDRLRAAAGVFSTSHAILISVDKPMKAENHSSTSSPMTGSNLSAERENVVRGGSQSMRGKSKFSNGAARDSFRELVSEGSPAVISRTLGLCFLLFNLEKDIIP
jgi:hypothetical protein